MESSSIFKFWRNAIAGADVISSVNDLPNSAFGTDDDDTDDDDSLFDLDINSRNSDSTNEDSKKDFQFIESPRDVFLSKNDFSNSKPSSPISFLCSTPKLKFVLFGFRKSSNCVKTEPGSDSKASQLSQLSKIGQSGRSEAPVAAVFARENSLRSRLLKESSDYEYDVVQDKSVPKYVKLMKHFSPKGSKKAKATDSVTPSSSPPVNLSPRKFSEGSRMNSFKIVSKNLGKSRSASAEAGAAPSLLRRRDDCLLDDGIQGAILHCKKSLDGSSQDFPQLSRSASDPSNES